MAIQPFSDEQRDIEMRNPFTTIPPHTRRAVFLSLLVLTILLMVLLNVIGAPLTTDAASNGIVSFELAGSVSQARRILESWDQVTRLRAAFSLGLDFLFLVAYSTTISLACGWAAGMIGTLGWPLASAGVPLAWAQWLAASLDAIENVALVTILFGTVSEPWPQIARWCAAVKFGLIPIGLAYAALGAIAWTLSRSRH